MAAIDRECVVCGKVFRGERRKCWSCVVTERECVSCRRTFRGAGRKCCICRTGREPRTCSVCGGPLHQGHLGICTRNPECKLANKRARNAEPETIAKDREYRQRPESKERSRVKQRARNRTPAGRQYLKQRVELEKTEEYVYALLFSNEGVLKVGKASYVPKAIVRSSKFQARRILEIPAPSTPDLLWSMPGGLAEESYIQAFLSLSGYRAPVSARRRTKLPEWFTTGTEPPEDILQVLTTAQKSILEVRAA